MHNKNKELGKGIEALIRDNIISDNQSSNFKISIDKIVPNKKNPRKNFDKKKLEELKRSIFEIVVWFLVLSTISVSLFANPWISIK